MKIKLLKLIKEKGILFLSIALIVTLTFCLLGLKKEGPSALQADSESERIETMTIESTEAETQTVLTQEDKEVIQEEAKKDADERDKLIKSAPAAKSANVNPSQNSANRFVLPVNCILQKPELPTGCEVTSLAIALNYIGLSVDKCFLADNFLPKGGIGTVSPWDAFVGNPRDSHSYGCYAPVIVNTASSYLSSVGAKNKYKVSNITGYNRDQLFEILRGGTPVIIWGAINISKAPYPTTTWHLPRQDVTWLANEHCMVLIGYDLNTSKVIVADPLRGNVEYDMNLFFTRYSQLYSQAVIIRPLTAQETTTEKNTEATTEVISTEEVSTTAAPTEETTSNEKTTINVETIQ